MDQSRKGALLWELVKSLAKVCEKDLADMAWVFCGQTTERCIEVTLLRQARPQTNAEACWAAGCRQRELRIHVQGCRRHKLKDVCLLE